MLGVACELVDDRADDRARGLGTAVEQQDALGDDLLVGPRSTVGLGVDPRRDQVVLRVLAPLGDDLHRGSPEVGDGAAHLPFGWVLVHPIGRSLAGLEHRDLGPLADLGPHLARVAELLADDDRRQRRRQQLDGIARSQRCDGVDEFGHDLADVGLDLLDGAWRELARHDHALLLMIGIVLVDHGRVGALIGSRPRPIERRVPLRVPLDLDDVGVARHAPDLLDRIPVARRVIAQPTVGLERIHIEQRVEQVDRRRVGDGHDSPRRSRRTHSLGGLRERAGPAAPCAPRRTQPRPPRRARSMDHRRYGPSRAAGANEELRCDTPRGRTPGSCPARQFGPHLRPDVRRTAGWVAHGLAEFDKRPSRFGTVSRWVG
ncbi:unannotated protein [freshwater metagenome]|uniref:Unannotated protein n=1 Tax=freshwater metagenome TaxID=449393 RepID=A0A6J7AHL7_9ZZZZ